jgi:hypothetical protein
MTHDDLVRWLEETPLAKLAFVFKILVQRVYSHRLANKGFVPPEIFESCIGMSGVAASVQIVNEVVDAGGDHLGYALKLREEGEVGDAYKGTYHNTCCSVRLFDTPATALGRDTKEAFGRELPDEELEFLGVTIHDEPARFGADMTVMHRRKVTLEQMQGFVGTWRMFTNAEVLARDPLIVASNCDQLSWVMDPKRPPFADVRGGWKPRS